MPLAIESHAASQPLPPSPVPGLNPNSPHEKSPRSSSHSTPEGAEYLALAARATNDALRDWDVVNGALSWPQGLARLLGYTQPTAGRDIRFWQENLHEEDRSRTTRAVREALARADHWSGEYRFRHADGRYLHLLERAAIERDGDGRAVRWVGSLMDITARQQMQDQLCRSQKMEAFGQLAGGVAHDFNNFLTAILGYSDLLLSDNGLRGSFSKHVREIRSAAGRASALTSQLLAFSRKHPLEPRLVEVNALITNLERSLLRLVGENIAVECDLQRSRDGAYVKVDPGQLTQVVLNLVVNARDAIPDAGRVLLATGTLRITDSQPQLCSGELPAGNYISISVTDNGSGMSDEVKAHLFEPFFSTKHGTGSGLGLATSYGIVRQSGGHICVDSELGRGTTVTIYLPQLPAPPAPAYKKPGSKKLPVGTETVLVLEDDVSVRHIAVRMLRALGYDVLEAARADDAQRLIEGLGQRKLHLLLTDIVMPQMSGRHFAEWLRTESPETVVVFISGYLDESLQIDCSARGMFFLPKPFDSEQLAAKVREALDAAS
ncbi:MAG: ATP-binding protein [Verrucomicrobiota bacterium]|nr:ATP-binding protein [Verrucomicrobiota bacterium]